MSAAIDTGYEAAMQEAMDKWAKMTAEDRSAYSQRLRATTIELIVSRASRLGIAPKEIAERTGYTTAWVSNIGSLNGGSSFTAVAEFATSIGYPLSFFVAMAEDLMTIEDDRAKMFGIVKPGPEDE